MDPGIPTVGKAPFCDSDIIREGSTPACNIGLAYTGITVHVRARDIVGNSNQFERCQLHKLGV